MASLDEYVAKHDRSVGHHAVYAEIEEIFHFGRVIDGPHVYLNTESVGGLDKTLIDDGPAVRAGRKLGARGAEASLDGKPEARATKPRRLAWSHRRAQVRAEHLSAVGDPTVAERTYTDPIDCGVTLDGLSKRDHRPVILRVDVDAKVWPSAKDLVEPRNPFCLFHSNLIERGRGEVGDVTVGVRDASQMVVVKRKQLAISARVHVGLDVAVAEIDRVLKGRECVLWPIARATTMSKGDHSIVVEKRMPAIHATDGSSSGRCHKVGRRRPASCCSCCSGSLPG